MARAIFARFGAALTRAGVILRPFYFAGVALIQHAVSVELFAYRIARLHDIRAASVYQYVINPSGHAAGKAENGYALPVRYIAEKLHANGVIRFGHVISVPVRCNVIEYANTTDAASHGYGDGVSVKP